MKVRRVDDSYPEDELLEVFEGQDAVVCAIPIVCSAEQSRMINAASRAGVKRFVPSIWGNPAVGSLPEIAPAMSEHKNGMLGNLKGKQATGMTWTSVVCGPFFDW